MASTFSEQLPAPLDMKKAHESTFKLRPNGVMDSLATVLLQELERFNRLLGKRQSLDPNRKASPNQHRRNEHDAA